MKQMHRALFITTLILILIGGACKEKTYTTVVEGVVINTGCLPIGATALLIGFK